MESVTFSHPSERGSPQEKRGNVFGHFLTLTPQQGGQICVIQTGFMEGVFRRIFREGIFCFKNTRHEASLVHANLTSWLRR